MPKENELKKHKLIGEVEESMAKIISNLHSKGKGAEERMFISFIDSSVSEWKEELHQKKTTEIDFTKELEDVIYGANLIISFHAHQFNKDYIIKNVEDLSLKYLVGRVTLPQNIIERELIKINNSPSIWNESLERQPLSKEFIKENIDRFDLIYYETNELIDNDAKEFIKNIIQTNNSF